MKACSNQLSHPEKNFILCASVESLPRQGGLTAVISSLWQKSRDGLVSILFPTECPFCQQEILWGQGAGICESCWQSIRPWQGSQCTVCGLPMLLDSQTPDPRCAPCRNNGYNFDLARSYGLYSFPLRNFILHLKFHRRERWGVRLGELLASLSPAQEAPKETLIMPVPLHASRERERGFNQAALLAVGLHRGLRRLGSASLPRLETKVLARVRPTPSQSGLHHGARQENVRGVFAVRYPELVRDRRILLIDDVMTTGATLSACALALKKAKAQEVIALTLARATPQFPDFHPIIGGS